MSVERHHSGLRLFGDRLAPAMLTEIESWADHPELNKLRSALIGHETEESFFDSYAEALVASHLLRNGCTIRWEVETPTGRTCDFQVERDGQRLFLHIKRVHGEREEPQRVTISPRLRYLERIERPYVVRVRWHESLTDAQMQRFVTRATEFIGHARIGDEMTIRDNDSTRTGGGTELGGVRIIAPSADRRVCLVIGLPAGFIDETPRIRKLLGRAYQQFMPGAFNVILACSMIQADSHDFQSALLGAHVERWDKVPAKGRRIAHGRDADGFWSGSRFNESVVAGWFAFAAADHDLSYRMWQRQDVIVEPPMPRLLGSLFGM